MNALYIPMSPSDNYFPGQENLIQGYHPHFDNTYTYCARSTIYLTDFFLLARETEMGAKRIQIEKRKGSVYYF